MGLKESNKQTNKICYRWVMYVEKKICDVDGKLTIYLGNLKRLSKRLDILQQVHDAPKVYAQFVIEVVRRRQFSHKFLLVSNLPLLAVALCKHFLFQWIFPYILIQKGLD